MPQPAPMATIARKVQTTYLLKRRSAQRVSSAKATNALRKCAKRAPTRTMSNQLYASSAARVVSVMALHRNASVPAALQAAIARSAQSMLTSIPVPRANSTLPQAPKRLRLALIVRKATTVSSRAKKLRRQNFSRATTAMMQEVT